MVIGIGKAIQSRTIDEICGKPKADVIEQVRRGLEKIRKDMDAREEQGEKLRV